MKRSRVASAALCAALIGLVLSGCSLLPQFTATANPAPKVGECWNTTLADADAWADWSGPAATSCSHTHVLYTYGIGEVKGVSASDWTAKGSTTALDPTIAATAEKTCDASYGKLLPTLVWSQQLVKSYFFVPSQAQWKAGARWVRCDVGVTATGTSVDKQKLSALPAHISTFTNLVMDDPERFDYCVNSPESVKKLGPLDSSKSIIADCTQGPQWELSSFADFPADATFPSKSTIQKATSEACSPDVESQGEVWTAYLPSKSQWKTGDREIDCWVGSDSNDSGTTIT
jgi:hypothetical protein